MGGGMSFVKEPWQQPNMQKTNSVTISNPVNGLTIPGGSKRNPQTLSGGSSLPAGSNQFNYQLPRRGTGNSELSPSESL
jgi:hypothetical protein